MTARWLVVVPVVFALAQAPPAGGGQTDREEGIPLAYKDLYLGMPQQEAESKLSGRDPGDVAEARAALEREEAQARIGAERTCRDQIDTNPQQLPREWRHDDAGRPVPPDALYQRCVQNRFDLWSESIRGRHRRIEGFILQKYRRIADVPVGPPKLAFHEGKLVQISVVAGGEMKRKAMALVFAGLVGAAPAFAAWPTPVDPHGPNSGAGRTPNGEPASGAGRTLG